MKLSPADAVAIFGDIALDAGITAEPLARFIVHEVVPTRTGAKKIYSIVAVRDDRDRTELRCSWRGDESSATAFARNLVGTGWFTRVDAYGERGPDGKRPRIARVRRA